MKWRKQFQDKFKTALKFIGGMLFTNKDRDAYLASGATSATPSLGTCAPGYFFVAGESAKCIQAANKLNCEEFGTSGGFSGGSSLDIQTDLANTCVACPGTKTNYVYNTKTSSGNIANVQFRVTVPKGTGKTTIVLSTKSTGAAGLTRVATYGLTDSGTLTIPNAKPEDLVQLDIFQEYPHRPRGGEEVFFVQFGPEDTDAEVLAKSIDCVVATLEDLQKGIFTRCTNTVCRNC